MKIYNSKLFFLLGVFIILTSLDYNNAKNNKNQIKILNQNLNHTHKENKIQASLKTSILFIFIKDYLNGTLTIKNTPKLKNSSEISNPQKLKKNSTLFSQEKLSTHRKQYGNEKEIIPSTIDLSEHNKVALINSENIRGNCFVLHKGDFYDLNMINWNYKKHG